MKKILFLFILYILFPLFSTLYSHPVTYKNGIAVSISEGLGFNSYINYSISSKRSYELRYLNLNSLYDSEFYFTQWNQLLKRWHFFDAQANIYIIQSLGFKSQTNAVTPCSRILMDYENRRFFSSIQAEIMTPQADTFLHLQSRIGFAPYKHNYTGVASWFMIQFQHLSYTSTTTQLMPLYRGFYKRYLCELGYNGKNAFYHIMIHI